MIRSQLDEQQIIQSVYDPAADRLRVDASIDNVTIIAGALEVATEYTDDSIAIGDPASNNILKINADGSINVDVSFVPPASNRKTILTYNEVTGVASGVETTIVSYTAPVGKSVYLTFISVAGTNITQYRIYQNASVIDKQYTMFGTSLSTSFDYRNDDASNLGYMLTSGDTIYVKTLHSRPMTGDFNARIQVVEIM